MGKEYKIEIDDRMPVDYKGQPKFPKSVEKTELWSQIITKALIKLINLTDNISLMSNLTGNGFIMYALTGLVS